MFLQGIRGVGDTFLCDEKGIRGLGIWILVEPQSQVGRQRLPQILVHERQIPRLPGPLLDRRIKSLWIYFYAGVSQIDDLRDNLVESLDGEAHGSPVVGLAGAFEQKLTVSPSRTHLKP